jgi:hypothetical protein
MKIEEWMVAESSLDDKQYEIYMADHNKSMVVAGSAGSGKTVLAVLRAKRMSGLGSYVLLVFNKALKAMIEFGFKAHRLSADSAIYAWAWENRGMDLAGLVFFKIQSRVENETVYYRDTIYLQKADSVDVYKISDVNRKSYYDQKYQEYIGSFSSLSKADKLLKEQEISKFVSIDFSDYVSGSMFSSFGRRTKYYEKSETVDLKNIDLANREVYESLSSSVLFVPYKFKINYLILDESQDFREDQLNSFNHDYINSIFLFGDTNQKLSDRGTKVERIKEILNHEYTKLDKNYRITREIARVAEYLLPQEDRTLVAKCNKPWGNPIPVFKKCTSIEEQIDFIIQTIKTEDLTDVGILVPTNKLVEYVSVNMQEKGQAVQRRYNKPLSGFDNNRSDFMEGEFGHVLYHQLDNLNFQSTLPCVLTYHSAKGTQFSTVFVPFANDSMHNGGLKKNPLYVALTRSSKDLYIIYQSVITLQLSGVSNQFYRSL